MQPNSCDSHAPHNITCNAADAQLSTTRVLPTLPTSCGTRETEATEDRVESTNNRGKKHASS
eukprot:6326506-Alexandrium_andersonii.AAC.1